ncbi:hypothetical protein QBC46DRAFT_454337 [Diplogelasinospora grovesii]|uniref:Secreted protein n=1 Tax=Diplogelasinospora grovesii TaxID=303347 RepID=A0AAN6MVG7_9PEZI|nr:hypothetical protein QBC46DRAFT_454337 [Diplogelasinospora grovesii]
MPERTLSASPASLLMTLILTPTFGRAGAEARQSAYTSAAKCTYLFLPFRYVPFSAIPVRTFSAIPVRTFSAIPVRTFSAARDTYLVCQLDNWALTTLRNRILGSQTGHSIDCGERDHSTADVRRASGPGRCTAHPNPAGRVKEQASDRPEPPPLPRETLDRRRLHEISGVRRSRSCRRRHKRSSSRVIPNKNRSINRLRNYWRLPRQGRRTASKKYGNFHWATMRL